MAEKIETPREVKKSQQVIKEDLKLNKACMSKRVKCLDITKHNAKIKKETTKEKVAKETGQDLVPDQDLNKVVIRVA